MKTWTRLMTSATTLLAASALAGCMTDGAPRLSNPLGGGKPLYERVEGPYIDSVDFERAANRQRQTDPDDDIHALALRSDSGSQRRFYGLVHATLFQSEALHRHLVRDEEALKFVDTVKDRLLRGWQGEAPEIGFVITADPNMRGIAYEQNFILIPIGLLISAESDDEVAALIAHEMAHILLGHFADEDSKDAERRFTQGLDAIGTYSAKARTTRARIDENGNVEYYEVADEDAEELRDHIQLASMLTREVARTVYFPSLSREQEDAADLLGMDLMAKAGYNPNGMSSLLLRTAEQVKHQEARLDVLQEQERAAARKAAVAIGLDPEDTVSIALLETGLDIYSNWRANARKTHRDIEERQTNAAAYARREYRALGGASSTEAIDRLRRQRGTKLEAYKAAFEAETALARSADETLGRLVREASIDEAVEASRKAVRSGGAADSYVRFLRYEVLNSAGNSQGAFLELAEAAKKETASAEVYERFARELINRRRFAEAASHVVDDLAETDDAFEREVRRRHRHDERVGCH